MPLYAGPDGTTYSNRDSAIGAGGTGEPVEHSQEVTGDYSITHPFIGDTSSTYQARRNYNAGESFTDLTTNQNSTATTFDKKTGTTLIETARNKIYIAPANPTLFSRATETFLRQPNYQWVEQVGYDKGRIVFSRNREGSLRKEYIDLDTGQSFSYKVPRTAKIDESRIFQMKYSVRKSPDQSIQFVTTEQNEAFNAQARDAINAEAKKGFTPNGAIHGYTNDILHHPIKTAQDQEIRYQAKADYYLQSNRGTWGGFGVSMGVFGWNMAKSIPSGFIATFNPQTYKQLFIDLPYDIVTGHSMKYTAIGDAIRDNPEATLGEMGGYSIGSGGAIKFVKLSAMGFKAKATGNTVYFQPRPGVPKLISKGILGAVGDFNAGTAKRIAPGMGDYMPGAGVDVVNLNKNFKGTFTTDSYIYPKARPGYGTRFEVTISNGNIASVKSGVPSVLGKLGTAGKIVVLSPLIFTGAVGMPVYRGGKPLRKSKAEMSYESRGGIRQQQRFTQSNGRKEIIVYRNPQLKQMGIQKRIVAKVMTQAPGVQKDVLFSIQYPNTKATTKIKYIQARNRMIPITQNVPMKAGKGRQLSVIRKVPAKYRVTSITDISGRAIGQKRKTLFPGERREFSKLISNEGNSPQITQQLQKLKTVLRTVKMVKNPKPKVQQKSIKVGVKQTYLTGNLALQVGEGGSGTITPKMNVKQPETVAPKGWRSMKLYNEVMGRIKAKQAKENPVTSATPGGGVAKPHFYAPMVRGFGLSLGETHNGRTGAVAGLGDLMGRKKKYRGYSVVPSYQYYPASPAGAMDFRDSMDIYHPLKFGMSTGSISKNSQLNGQKNFQSQQHSQLLSQAQNLQLNTLGMTQNSMFGVGIKNLMITEQAQFTGTSQLIMTKQTHDTALISLLKGTQGNLQIPATHSISAQMPAIDSRVASLSKSDIISQFEEPGTTKPGDLFTPTKPPRGGGRGGGWPGFRETPFTIPKIPEFYVPGETGGKTRGFPLALPEIFKVDRKGKKSSRKGMNLNIGFQGNYEPDVQSIFTGQYGKMPSIKSIVTGIGRRPML